MAEGQRSARTRAQQREETAKALIAEARWRFATDGYAGGSLSEIVSATGVTKGALYHHFSGKEGLFRAVLQQVHQEVADRIAATAPDADPWTQLVEGCRTFLAATTEPGIQQIMLVDAPAVLGWGVWRELDAATSMQQLEEILRILVDQGVIVNRPIAPMTHLLSGAMNEAALWLARSKDRDRDLDDAMLVLTGFLESLRVV